MEIILRQRGRLPRNLDVEDARRIVGEALQRVRNKVKRVCLYIEDVNGPRGGVDKQCRCVLHLDRMEPVVISDKDAGARSLLHRVANRASGVVRNRLSRRRSKRRRLRSLGLDRDSHQMSIGSIRSAAAQPDASTSAA